jgi:SAM-dependent methyltransferase
VERFLSRLPPAGRVLDAACGTGKYFPMVLASGRSLLGVDHAGAALAIAAAKFPQIPTDKQDLQELPYRGEFDGVLCVDAMEFVPPEEWPPVLERLRRALRSGGWLYLTVELAPADRVRAANQAGVACRCRVHDGGGGGGALAPGGVRLSSRAGPPRGHARLRMSVPLALGLAAITLSGAARLQRITWPRRSRITRENSGPHGAHLKIADKDEAGGSSPPRPTKRPLSSGNACSLFLGSAESDASLVSNKVDGSAALCEPARPT